MISREKYEAMQERLRTQEATILRQRAEIAELKTDVAMKARKLDHSQALIARQQDFIKRRLTNEADSVFKNLGGAA